MWKNVTVASYEMQSQDFRTELKTAKLLRTDGVWAKN
jgi:hypothetical protein